LDEEHVNPFKTKGKEEDERKKKQEEWTENFITLKVPRQCPLVLLAKVG
jgi:hypothetical protein